MATTMAQIRQGLANNLSVLEGQVSPYMLAAPTPPAIHMLPTEVNYDQALQRGLTVAVLTVQAMVAFGLDVSTQQRLDGWVQGELKAAAESDPTLGGTVQYVRVVAMTSYDVLALPDRGQMLAASFRVEVYV